MNHAILSPETAFYGSDSKLAFIDSSWHRNLIMIEELLYREEIPTLIGHARRGRQGADGAEHAG